MSLENLLRVGQLKAQPPDADEIDRLLTATQRNLRDAGVAGISAETQFDAAYKCIMSQSVIGVAQGGMRGASGSIPSSNM